MSNIKDKITPGEWYSNSHYVRTSNETTYSIGHAYADNPSKVGEGEANAKLWAASKEMLDILEDIAQLDIHAHFTVITGTEQFDDLKQKVINLLKQLNQ